MNLAEAALSLVVYVLAGAFSAAILMVGRRLIRANKADMESAISSAVNDSANALKGEFTDRFTGVEQEISAVRSRLEREMGGNSHGLRQAINEIAEEVHTMSGAFHQHILERKD